MEATYKVCTRAHTQAAVIITMTCTVREGARQEDTTP